MPNSLSWGALHPGSLFLGMGGVDEVGRGCIAGPVVAAALWVPPETREHPVWLEVCDSKKVSEAKREALAGELWRLAEARAVFAGVAWATEDEIEAINILHATGLAMERAAEQVERLLREHALGGVAGPGGGSPLLWRVDGNWLPPGLRGRGETLVRGDAQDWSIAGASILAKTYRDAWMRHLEPVERGMRADAGGRFSFATHKGYPTPLHLQELDAWGPSSCHRRGFEPVRARLAGPFEATRA